MKTKNFCSVACILTLLITLAMFVFSPSAQASTISDSVYIDIKPGSCPNSLHVNSKGVLSVAILGTPEFDVTTIDPETIRIEGVVEDVAPLRWSYEDIATPFEGELYDCHDYDGDGYLDLGLKFKTQELVLKLDLNLYAGQIISLTITGNLKGDHSGTPIMGEDCVRVLGED